MPPSVTEIASLVFTQHAPTCQVKTFYSSGAEILFGFPPRSILGPINFNIFLFDLFLFIKNKDVASFADDKTPHETGGNSLYVIHNLEFLGNTLLKRFNDNSMKTYPGYYQFILSRSDSSKITIGNKTISCSKYKKLLESKMGNNLNFKEHIESLC